MASYEWCGAGEFVDNANDRTISPGETVEISAQIAETHPEFREVDADEPENSSEESEGLPGLEAEEWQSMASAYDFEDVDGRNSAEDIQAAFEDLSDEEQAAALESIDGE